MLSTLRMRLKEKLAKYENPKNSNNSSIPPSKDENRPFKSKSLRKKTGRKPVGQKGHEGTTLEMVSDPNEIIDHSPKYCECRGKDIGAITGEFVERRQQGIQNYWREFSPRICKYCSGTRLLEKSFSDRCSNSPTLHSSSAQGTQLSRREVQPSMA